jgi:putative chitinase
MVAARSAGWFWTERRLNPLADSGDMKTLTLRINGGLNGYDDRLALYHQALTVLNSIT